MTTFRPPNLDDFDELVTSAAHRYRELASDAKERVVSQFIKAGHGAGNPRMYLTAQHEIMPLFRETLKQFATYAIEFHQIHGFTLQVMLDRFEMHAEKMIEVTLDIIQPRRGNEQLACDVRAELMDERKRFRHQIEIGYLDGQRIPAAQKTARREAIKLLRSIYDAVKGDFRGGFDPFEIGERIGMDPSDIRSAESYLSMSGLIKATSFDTNKYKITLEGIQEIEQLIESPFNATAHLPAIMSVHIGQNINSPIQQGLGTSKQEMTLQPEALANAHDLIEEIKAKLEIIAEGDAELREELRGVVASLEPQVQSRVPNPGILKAALAALLDICKRAANAALTADLQARIAQVLSHIE